MKTIKIINLLNKIANGEEVPKKIKWEDTIYAYSDIDKDYLEYPFSDYEYQGLFCMKDSVLTQYLNEEVEIIEDTPKVQVEMTQQEYNEYLDNKLNTPKEDKKIKRIRSNGESLYSEYIGEWLIHKERYTEYDELLMNKINEIIDKINGE